MKKYTFYLEHFVTSMLGFPVRRMRKKSTYAHTDHDARQFIKAYLPDRLKGCMLCNIGTKETLIDKPWMKDQV